MKSHRDLVEHVWESYLVEHYRPGLCVEELQRAASLLRAAAAAMEREGSSLRYVRSTIVPRDEAFLAFFEATEESLVREAYRRAGVPFERISTAVPADI